MADEIDNMYTVAIKVTAANANNEFTIYTPSVQNISGESIRYYGLLNTLRMNANITSLSPIVLDALDPAATPEQINAYNNALANQNRKALQIILRKGEVDAEVAEIGIYPNRPRYMANIIRYFTELQLYGIQYGVSVVGKIIDIGWGVLEDSDWITITGSVIEKTNVYFNSETNSPINLIF